MCNLAVCGVLWVFEKQKTIIFMLLNLCEVHIVLYAPLRLKQLKKNILSNKQRKLLLELMPNYENHTDAGDSCLLNSSRKNSGRIFVFMFRCWSKQIKRELHTPRFYGRVT